VKVLAWNVQGLRGGLDPIAGFIRDIAPDAACLNEVPRGSEPRLARASRRTVARGATLLGPRYRNALFARRPEWVRRVRLSRTPGLARRGCVIAGLGGLAVASTHLGLDALERERHAHELLSALADLPSLILCGDVNERPEGPASRVLAERFTDACPGGVPTFPAAEPVARIDRVLLTPAVRVIRCDALDTTLSDHRPVIAELATP
jgi:endonuclease/exonuclease/phosphatase family metal-dependent hydrolase